MARKKDPEVLKRKINEAKTLQKSLGQEMKAQVKVRDAASKTSLAADSKVNKLAGKLEQLEKDIVEMKESLAELA
jgi:polyhydroxyalkanoate synthesis regulator phasin